MSNDKLESASPLVLLSRPYVNDALVPVISANTIGFHYGKHHKGYVDNLSKLVAGTKFADLPLDKIISETDFTEDLKKFDVPALIIHGDDDQIVPIGAAALLSAKLVKNSILKIYPGAPHGIAYTHKDQLNADLLAFIKGTPKKT